MTIETRVKHEGDEGDTLEAIISDHGVSIFQFADGQDNVLFMKLDVAKKFIEAVAKAVERA